LRVLGTSLRGEGAVWDEAADGLCQKGASAVDQMRGVAIVGKLWFRGAV
jgi:hypothetical protein